MTLLGILTYIFRAPCGPGVDTASNINERQGYHLGMNAMVCRAEKFSSSSADCLDFLGASTSWSTKGLSRPVLG